MIHRASRRRLALALRRYLAKRVTNDELDEVEVDWRDRGAVAVKEMAWRLYDDMYTHRATGRHTIGREGRRMIARWVVFLLSEEEYLWPEYSFIEVSSASLSLLTLGWWGRVKARRWREFTEAGDFDAWPFISKVAEQSARARPIFLSHGSA